MIKRNFLINTFILIISIYVPLIFFSIFLLSKNKVWKREFFTDISEKIESFENGYSPLFYPAQLRSFSENYEIYPLGTLPNKNTFYCNEGYGLIKFKSDRFGLRNNDNNWNNLLNQKNIFFLGDSFVQGACIEDEFVISNFINKKTQINTLNLGTGGNGPYEYMNLLNSIIKPALTYSKKNNYVVLIFYSFDGAFENPKIKNLLKYSKNIVSKTDTGEIFPNKKYTESIQKLIYEKYSYSDKETKNKIRNKKLNPLYQIFTLVPIRQIIKIARTPEIKYDPKSSIESITLLSQVCKNKCTPIVAYIPHSFYWEPKIKWEKTYKETLKNKSENLNINFVDGAKVIDRNNLDYFAPSGNHFSKRGYQIFSNYLLDQIKL